jgi:PAS domain S-box-containing protein
MNTYERILLASISSGLIAVVVILLVVIRMLKRSNAAKAKGAINSKLASTLRDEKLKSGIILNAIEDGVVLVDDQQVIRLFNPGASKITGWSGDDAVGLSWQAVFKIVNTKGEAVAPAQDPVPRLFATKETIRDSTANLLTKSGKIIAISLVVSPILDEHQRVTGAVGVLRDVSEERKEEQQRAEFISTASHEMRTPVAAIEGYLALALNDKVSTIDTRARNYLEKAHASTQHLGKLFQDLLTSAKAEDGRLTSHPDVIEIGSFLEQLTNDLRFAAEKKGLGVDFVFGTSRTIDASKGGPGDKIIKPLYYTFADPDRMREVITNLFDNAVKYTDAGKISLGLTGNDQVVQFFVRDTGFGIPAEDIPHMFQKFYRVDNSATRTIGGTGLGLFICRKIVELYGGRIWVESELGKGSTFYINLPRLSATKANELKAKVGNEQVLQPINSLASAT